jgi:hypothetical protein
LAKSGRKQRPIFWREMAPAGSNDVDGHLECRVGRLRDRGVCGGGFRWRVAGLRVRQALAIAEPAACRQGGGGDPSDRPSLRMTRSGGSTPRSIALTPILVKRSGPARARTAATADGSEKTSRQCGAPATSVTSSAICRSAAAPEAVTEAQIVRLRLSATVLVGGTGRALPKPCVLMPNRQVRGARE